MTLFKKIQRYVYIVFSLNFFSMTAILGFFQVAYSTSWNPKPENIFLNLKTSFLVASFFQNNLDLSTASKKQSVNRKEKEIKNLRAEIKRRFGYLKCETSSDCHVIGVGVSPCGGPQKYEIYSLWGRKDQSDIESKVKIYNSWLEISPSKSFGVCVVNLPPETLCMKSICIKKSP